MRSFARNHRRRLFVEQLESRRLCAVNLLNDADNNSNLDGSSNVVSGFVTSIINGTTTSLYPSVGTVGDSTGGYCTGTLIAPRYVLTAAHCLVEGTVVLGNTQGRFTVGGATIQTSQVIVHPNYSEATFGTDTANDIALLRLNQDVTSVTPSPIFRSVPTVGTSLTMVGFGGGGNGTTGTDGSFGTKRVGTTPIDRISSTLIHWSFDNNSESNTAPGDSGGPAFIDVGGTLFVAGVTSGGEKLDASIGDQSYDTRVDVYQAWIDSIVNPTSTSPTIQYTTSGANYVENFDSLANSGSGSATPSGWSFSEVGTNSNTSYTAANGNQSAGDTYSFGATGSTDRALGTLLSNSNTSTVGAAIQNRTGQALVSMTIGYAGEQWRLGTAGRQDKLDFQYSLNATDLLTGTWIDVDNLDAIAPATTGTSGSALDGNLVANRVNRSATIGAISIPNEAVFWIRWTDLNASGADDGIGIDDFTFNASTSGGPVNTPPTISKPADVNTPFQTATSPIAFTVGDIETATADLIVSASSSNTTLLPNTGIALGGANANRTIVLTPAAVQSGTTTITLSVSDGQITTTSTFVLTVQNAPTSTSGLRIVSWNFSGASGNGTPRAGFDTLMQAMGTEVVAGFSRPVDLFALQEVLSQATTSAIVAASLNNTYSTTAYAHGTLNGNTTGAGTQGVVYNSSTLQLLSEAAIGTASTTGAPRQTLRYKFRPVGTFGESDFYVYNSHLKSASDGDARRLIEAQAIRNDADALGQGAHILYVGDFNLTGSSESAYVEFLSAGNGQAFDPINRPGNWSSNASFRDIFTQAPAFTPANGLDGGGLDDRYDFQLISGEFNDGTGLEYRPGSYRTFGNNGSVAVNGNIDDSSSTALPGFSNRLALLTLLRNVCDHLPVVADFTLPVHATITNRQVFYNRSTSTAYGDGSGNPINAIDPSKLALLPGGTTTAANYTNYSRGLNGLVIDIRGVANLAGLSASNFQLAAWSNFTDSTPNFVSINPSVTVSTFPGAGLGGADRVKLSFADNAIQNSWLRVTVLANSNTGLATNDVFYFGNARLDVTPAAPFPLQQVVVNAFDVNQIRARQGLDSGQISNSFDVDKNGVVNVFDTNAVRAGLGTASLRSFTAPSNSSIIAFSALSIGARQAAAVDSSFADPYFTEFANDRTRRRSRLL
jgi:secreted trypsin-like serine protease